MAKPGGLGPALAMVPTVENFCHALETIGTTELALPPLEAKMSPASQICKTFMIKRFHAQHQASSGIPWLCSTKFLNKKWYKL